MNRRVRLEIYIVIPLILSITKSIFINAGTSSTPKIPVNLYSHSLNDNSNSTNFNQFQNEYQYRQSVSKPTISSDRYKSTLPSTIDSTVEHLTSEGGSLGQLDYSYQDNRGTTNVPECRGRLRLNGTRGYITEGPGFYPTNLQCIWLIDSGRNNATIRIQFHQFNTECNYDYLYIFDGDSIYSPLVASLSGEMKDFGVALDPRHENWALTSFNQTVYSNSSSIDSSSPPSLTTSVTESRPFEIKTTSGKAFIYFHSDTAQTMPGFYMTYSIDSCSLDCSNRGECDYTSLTCRCNPGYFGEGCQYLLCPNNCTYPNGTCDKEKSCICNSGYHGSDCSLNNDHQTWVDIIDHEFEVPSRAFHQSIVVDNRMWVIGGKVQALSNTNMGIFRLKKTSMVYNFDITSRKWSKVILEGITGIDHLAELSGHSVAAKGNKIFIYGGMAMNNTVLDSLSVLDTKANSITSLPNGKKSKNPEQEFVAPVAVVGHSANIIGSHMYVFLGYNPLYGYMNFVQRFNLADNSWSFVEKKGSSLPGSIGHSTTFDPVSRLVYLYGGHSWHRLSNLYSFDPHTEIWTYLQAGPSSRYFHSSIIIDRQLIILGGNTYNTSYNSDQCFQQTHLTYDLTCSKPSYEYSEQMNSSVSSFNCGRKCWQMIEDPEPGLMKRQGHSVVEHQKNLILFGGFNGILLNDLRYLNISTCEAYTLESDCSEPKLALSCYWNFVDLKCESQPTNTNPTTIIPEPPANCTKSDVKSLQSACGLRETCTDCLNTNIGCVWCGLLSQCQYNKCKSTTSKAILDPNLCHKDEFVRTSFINMNFGHHSIKDGSVGQDLENEMECKRLENCYLCHSRSHCSWQSEMCVYSPPSVISSPTSSLSPSSQDELSDIYGNNPIAPRPPIQTNATKLMQRLDPFNRSFLAALTTSLLNSSPYHSCEVPCYMRRSCNECVQTKCIWCSTTGQCIDSSAYFAYHSMGQCMHYVAYMPKCPLATCADIETCDKCLTNPKCGWLNDISNSGKGRCIEGTSNGPSIMAANLIGDASNSSSTSLQPAGLQNWYYSSCPACQCNGHSNCTSNSSICIQPCLDNTEGLHCDKCVPGYFGNPINGGSCRPCRCNGHAQSCNRETGKCYCSTKGIIGHDCNKCDDQNHYIGDPSNPINGTCYYNLTTDYQYTFNMSKPEDHFYSDINFINVPLRKDSDVDFTIACSRLALVNITSGTSYKDRKLIQSGLECGSFRLRFGHDRHLLTETNYSFFVRVYKFQTPFILQIAFSQHRTLYLPQFFFTFSR